MTFEPIMPLPVLAVLGVVLIGGCCALAVATPARRAAWVMRGAAALLLIAACLRPGVPMAVTTEVPTAAADVFLVIDTTASAVAEDWDGDKPRLDGIRSDVDALLDQLPGARVSVITFTSAGTVRVPLTTDHAAVRSALEVLRPERTTASAGSSVTAAREVLADRLDASAKRHPDHARFVYYFGDGEQTSGQDPEPMSEIADRISGGQVFGYGTQRGGRMRETTGFGWSLDGDSGQAEQNEATEPKYIEDPQTQQDARSVIDEDQLKAIAEQLGVDYVHREAGRGFDSQFSAPQLKPSAGEEHVADGRVDYFWVPLLGVLALVSIDAGRMLGRVRSLGRLYTQLRRSR